MTSGPVSVANGDPGRACAILLGDAHPLFRSGMRYMLQEALAPVEIAEAGSRREALAQLERGSFNLVLTSLFSAEGDWNDFLADLLQRAPAGRLMILSSVDEPMHIRRILAAGAAGFVLKETPPNITLHAIRLVLAGGIYIPPAALRALSDAGVGDGDIDGAAYAPATSETTDPALADDIPLTERQQAVLPGHLAGCDRPPQPDGRAT